MYEFVVDHVSWPLAGAGALIACWGMLIVLARTLPPGPARELAAFLPDCATALRRLRRDPRVPRGAKVAVLVAAVWVLSPIDLIPEFLPVIGPLDDVVVVALALRYAARRVPLEVLLAAWPGDPRLLLRLTGRSGTVRAVTRTTEKPVDPTPAGPSPTASPEP